MLLLADLARHEGARLYTLKDEGRRFNAKSSVSPYGPSLGRQAFGAGRRAGRRETRAPSNATQAQGLHSNRLISLVYPDDVDLFSLSFGLLTVSRAAESLLALQQHLLSGFVSRLAQHLLVTWSNRRAIDPPSCSLSGRRSICQSKTRSRFRKRLPRPTETYF